MAIVPKGTLNPHGGPVLRHLTLGNTITVTRYDALEASSGFAVLGTSANGLLGHVVDIETNNGTGLLTTGAAGAAIGSFTNTYATASTNQTVELVKAVTDISKQTLYSAEVDATIGTTTGSNLLGYFMDLVDEDTLAENSAVTTTAQYHNWGLAPESTARAYVNLHESLIFGPF